MNNRIIQKKIVGAKQTLKAIKSGKAQKVYIAEDAESKVTRPIIEACKEYSIEINYIKTMQILGEMCSIDVGAAIACTLND